MKRIAILLLVTTLIVSCEKNKFKRSTFLTEFYQFKIDPELQSAVTRFQAFSDQWSAYQSTPSVSGLTAIREAFSVTLNEVDRIQFYNLGEISQTYIYNKFNKFNIDTVEMWNYYSNASVITESEVSSLANPRKGMYAIEYLLFADFAEDSVMSSKYRSWISAYIADVESNLSTLKTSWGVYQKNFTEMLDDGVDGSFNIVCNRIIHSLEDIIDKRISPPLESGNIQQGVGYLSENCLPSIKTQVQQLADVFTGNGTESFHSIYNYLRKKNKKLAEEVKADFDEITTYQNGLTKSMEWYLANDSKAIDTYKQMLTDLLVKFKLDVTAAMGVILTFGDTDGD